MIGRRRRSSLSRISILEEKYPSREKQQQQRRLSFNLNDGKAINSGNMGRELRLLTLGGNRPEVEKKAKGGHELVHRHRKSLVLPITKFQWNKDENFLVEEDRIIEPINSNSNVEFSDKLQAGTDSLLASSDKVLLEGQREWNDETYFQRLLLNKQIIVSDRAHLTMETRVLRRILKDLCGSLAKMQTVNSQLNVANQLYNIYIHGLRIQHLPSDGEVEVEQQRNLQLKVLILERKIETLKYVLRKYRVGNKEEINNFEKKINQFRPNLQLQLTRKLAEENQVNEDLRQKIEFFERQCERNCGQIRWLELVDEMRAWKRKNDELTLQNQNLIYSLTGMQENIAVLKEEVEKVEEFKTEIKRLNKRNQEDMELLRQAKIQLIGQENKCKDLEQLNEITKLKLEGLRKINSKGDETEIKVKNKYPPILQLTKEKKTLQESINTAMNSFASRLQKTKKTFDQIHVFEETNVSLRSRIEQNLAKIQFQDKEQIQFVDQLFGKIRYIYEQIVHRQLIQSAQYHSIFEAATTECCIWKALFEVHMASQKRKQQMMLETCANIATIAIKQRQCASAYAGTSIEAQCPSCKQYVKQWLDINEIYEQTKQLLSRIRTINDC